MTARCDTRDKLREKIHDKISTLRDKIKSAKLLFAILVLGGLNK